MQAFGNEIEVLIQLDCSNHLGTLGILVAAYQIGIRVGIGTVLIVTEHYMLYSHVVIIGREICREKDWVRVDHLLIDSITAVQRSGVVGKVTCKTNGQFSCLCQINVNIGTQRIGLLVDIIVEGISLVDLEDTCIFRETTSYIIGSYTAAASRGNICTIRCRKILEEHIVPVVGRVDQPVGTGLAGLLNLVETVHKFSERVTRGDGLVVSLHICDRVCKLNCGSRL